jgi:hypothetical protein
VQYPGEIVLSEDEKSVYSVPETVEVPEYRRRRDNLATHFPSGTYLCPGARFGTLVGTVSGTLETDILWANPWTPLFKEEGVLALSSLLDTFSFVRAGVDDLSSLFCPIAPPSAELGIEVTVCSSCGRVILPPDSSLARVTMASGEKAPLIRVKHWPTKLIATQQFASAIAELGLVGGVAVPIGD